MAKGRDFSRGSAAWPGQTASSPVLHVIQARSTTVIATQIVNFDQNKSNLSSLSLRDAKVAHLLLQAQYPVLGVDGYMPVVDVFSGRCEGNLRVVLAMGRWEQIVALQRTRAEECESATQLARPIHLLDVPPHSGAKVSFYSGGVNL